MSLRQPYNNGLYERMNDVTLQIFRTSIKASDWLLLNAYTLLFMNNKLCGGSKVSRSEEFLLTPTFHLEMLLPGEGPHEGHTTIQDWFTAGKNGLEGVGALALRK